MPKWILSPSTRPSRSLTSNNPRPMASIDDEIFDDEELLDEAECAPESGRKFACSEPDANGMYEHFRFVADKGQQLLRVDKFLVDHMQKASRNRIQQAADAGCILCNGKAVKSNYRVKPDDVITVVMALMRMKRMPNPMKADLRFAAKIVPFGFISMVTTLMLTLNYRVDTLMMGYLYHIPDTEIGFYSLGVSLSEYGWLIPDAFREVLFSRTAKDDAIEEVFGELGDEKVHHFLYPKNGCGTPGHVRANEAAEMAKALAAYIEAIPNVWQEDAE